MTLDEIKNLIEKDKGKFIIIEDGNPLLVLMSFEDYKKILGEKRVKDELKENPEPKSQEPIIEASPAEKENYSEEGLDNLPVE